MLLLENLRFHPGEEANDPGFADELASLGELYVGDAFSAAHRAHASVVGLAERLPSAAGRLMQAEIEALTGALENPERPVVAIIAGAKVSTKLELLGNLLAKVDAMILGGGMANTFLLAKGTAVGKSLCERDMTETAREIMARAEARGCEILLPIDARIAKEFKPGTSSTVVPIELVPEDAMILDMAPPARICSADGSPRRAPSSGMARSARSRSRRLMPAPMPWPRRSPSSPRPVAS